MTGVESDHEDLEFGDTHVYGCRLHAPLPEVDLTT
jgi:hypothetical protein